ncbi:hypothetical protein AB0I94_09095 [Streptomyces sp. NPDC050147]|uniref:hypothetical protein n=1 Tax=Streptomyces sp. NPDC050147 TaxID=3155513 RepID=UPI003440CA61
MASGQKPVSSGEVVDVRDVVGGVDEDRAGGGVAGQGGAVGEVVAVVEETAYGVEFAFVLGVLVEAGGDGGADVVCCDGHGDHLLK